jgi:hypothetical protein
MEASVFPIWAHYNTIGSRSNDLSLLELGDFTSISTMRFAWFVDEVEMLEHDTI